MTRLIITIVAAICLGAHALLGCCWSHFGALGSCGEPITAAHASHACGSDCTHDHSHEHPNEPCPCKCDCRATCNFLPTVKVDCDQNELNGFVLFMPQLDTSVELVCFVESREFVRSAPTAALPMRLHLWKQTLLV